MTLLRTVTVLGLLVAGCAGPPEPTTSENSAALTGACTPVCEDNRTVDGRQFILQIPEVYDGQKPLPLLLVLHGFGGDSKSHCTTGNGWYCKAETEGFFVAYLNGTECDPSFDDFGDDTGCDPAHLGRGWNNGITQSLGITVDDVQFVRDVVASVSAEVRVDSRRVYAMGFSNGAMMCHRLGAELPDLLAGVALAEGAIGRDQGDGTWATIPDATGSVPILIIHGTADTAIGYDGNTGGLCPCSSVADALEYWLAANPCRGPSSSVTDGSNTTTTFAGCYANNDVALITIDGGGHVWPSFGTDAAWTFLSKHSLTAD